MKTQVWVQVWWQIAAIALSSNVTILAQIVPDQTLPVGERSQVSGDLDTQIDGGAVRGSNLFHSFQQFSVPTGGSAFFNNGSTITNIISRVTGSSISNIDGLIRANGNANLFLINPNGILFGPNAQLNVGGSFIASTANSFVFDNGFAFSATDPQAPPLLTVNVPIGLQFGSNPGMIKSQGASLQVPNGQTFTLAGGAVNVDGGQLLAPGGRVELGGVSASGTVGLNRDGSLSFPDEVARADISLTNAAKVDIRADGGGSITVNAMNLEVREGSQLLADIRKGMGTPKAQAGDITINATNSVQFDGEDRDGADSGAFSTVESRAEGNSGSVSINTRFLEVRKGALLDASTFGKGNAGSVTINATERVRFDGAGIDGLESGARSEVVFGAGTLAVGTAGGVFITTRILEAFNGAQISTSTNGVGNGGRVVINAADLAWFDGEDEQGNPSGAFSNVNRRAVGNAGGVFITTRSLEVTNGAVISASTVGAGNAGGITINATDSVRFDGVDGEGNSSNASSQVNSRGVGNAGGVSIATRSLEVTDGAQISASTFGIGNAGGITINATDLARFDGEDEQGTPSGAFSSVQFSNIRNAPAEGNAGGISITTGSLELLNGALLDVSTDGIGNAGNISITARDSVSFSGRGTLASGTYSSVEPRAIGQAGNINITTNSLSLTNGGIVSANTFNQGNAGDITIRASDSVSFDGVGSDGSASGAFSRVDSRAIGRGGDIRITTDNLSLSNGALVNAATAGNGNAGNITFDAPRLTVAGGAQVLAETTSTGDGGSIVVNAPISVDLRRVDNSSPVLSVETSGSGQAGDITINTPSLTLAEQARITATATATNPQGGGSVTLNASNLDLAGIVGVFAETKGQAPAGTLQLNPYNNQPDLNVTLTPNSQISASTSGSGRGGDLIATAPNSITISGPGQLAVATSGVGNAGNINFTTRQLTLRDGVKISASTSGVGKAGDIGIKAEVFTLTGQGTGLFASTTPGSTGNGGNIAIDPRLVQIEDRATIAVDSQGSGTGGNIFVQADRLILNQQSSITAETASAQGGNITLLVPDLLLLRNQSRISTTAGTAQAGGDGGNITFNGNFIVAVPNEDSDISANAFSGRGGKVEITAQGIFGIQSRPQLTPLSDITASSEFGISGTVTLNTPKADPSRGTTTLPTGLVDTNALIANSCIARTSRQGRFTITGTGGVAAQPDDLANSSFPTYELVPDTARSQATTPSSAPRSEEAIVEPDGVYRLANGEVVLGRSCR